MNDNHSSKTITRPREATVVDRWLFGLDLFYDRLALRIWIHMQTVDTV